MMLYMFRILFLFSWSMIPFVEYAWASQNVDDDNDSSGVVSAQNLRALPVTRVERLMTAEQHVRYLKDGIRKARYNILITSYDMNHTYMRDNNLLTLLTSASERGVRIWCYSNDMKDVDNRIIRAFGRQINFDITLTHAKIFAVDNTDIAIGSYNWLNGGDWENGTLTLAGSLNLLKEKIWADIKLYRNIQFGNSRAIHAYQNIQNSSQGDWVIDDGTHLSYLHSVDAHSDFIQSIFENATQRIVVCSPFVSSKSDYQSDFTLSLLRKTCAREVHVFFVCREGDPQLPGFQQYLTGVRSPYMHLILMPDIHLKTVVSDDAIIIDGSFNWLSATRDECSEYHNHEVSLFIGGDAARFLINEFDKNSSVGKKIIKIEQEALQAQKSQRVKKRRLSLEALSVRNEPVIIPESKERKIVQATSVTLSPEVSEKPEIGCPAVDTTSSTASTSLTAVPQVSSPKTPQDVSTQIASHYKWVNTSPNVYRYSIAANVVDDLPHFGVINKNNFNKFTAVMDDDVIGSFESLEAAKQALESAIYKLSPEDVGVL